MDHRQFEVVARASMSALTGVELAERKLSGMPKKFDLVSPDGRIVGDAKYLTLVRGVKIPPAKFAEIGYHVWLLERIDASRRFLVFGNKREVPLRWLEKYGYLVESVEFFFIHENGTLEQLHSVTLPDDTIAVGDCHECTAAQP